MTSILRVVHYFSKVQENVFKNLSFISFSSWISITSNLKKTEVKLEFFNWYWYAINASKKNKELEEECHAIHWYARANNKYMKGYDKNKECLKYWDVNNLYGWPVFQKREVNNFEWIENTSQFNVDFVKNCNEENDEGCFLKIMFSILKDYMSFIMIYNFYLKVEKLVTNLHDKTEYVIYVRNLKEALNDKFWKKLI